MNRGQIRTELQHTGFGNNTKDVTRQNQWIQAAEEWVWNARDPQGVPVRWSFAQVDQAAFPVTAGTQPATPDDWDGPDWILDSQGVRLDELDPQRFDELFGPGMAAGQTGTPLAYKVMNRQITFGPTPGASQTMTVSYRRRLSHLNSSGTVVAGPMAVDSDMPLWDGHHMILVYHAGLIGGALASNPFVSMFQQLRDDQLAAMRNDLEAEFAPAQVWGDGRWRDVGW